MILNQAIAIGLAVLVQACIYILGGDAPEAIIAALVTYFGFIGVCDD